jgi:hypothetical protein
MPMFVAGVGGGKGSVIAPGVKAAGSGVKAATATAEAAGTVPNVAASGIATAGSCG